MSDLVTISGADFSGKAEHVDDAIRVALTGNADHLVIDAVEKLFTNVHAEAVRLGAKSAIIDLRQLEFMNSSCFKVLVSWISMIRDLEAMQQYTVQFVSNPSIHWQRRSLHSLRCFASELISVVEGKP
jgi:anti-anti-sigma factor